MDSGVISIGVFALGTMWENIRLRIKKSEKALSSQKAYYPSASSNHTDQSNAILQIQEQLEDHHQSINEDTSEIQANHAEIYHLRMQIERLREQMEELRLEPSRGPRNYPVEQPTIREQEVFMVLYTTDGFINQREVARRLGISDRLVLQYITNLMEKGIPITRKGHLQDMFLRLDSDFKELQAKENVAGINKQLTLTLATQGALH